MDILSINLFLIIVLISSPLIFGKNITKLKMINKDNILNINNQKRRNVENDNYIILYFNQDCNYSYGFINYYRYDIDYIINKNNKNIKYKGEEPLNVKKEYGIEIHFNKTIRNIFFIDIMMRIWHI